MVRLSGAEGRGLHFFGPRIAFVLLLDLRRCLPFKQSHPEAIAYSCLFEFKADMVADRYEDEIAPF